VLAWHQGPPPHEWPLIQNPLIFANVISDVSGPPPAPRCRRGQQKRIGIQLGTNNVRDAVLSENLCHNVATFLADSGRNTVRLCGRPDLDSCECPRAVPQ
jgi:hypothetical protein